MGIALPNLDRPLRISADPAMSHDEFWRFVEENPNLQMELAANGELIVRTPTHGQTGPRNAQIVFQLATWPEAERRGSVLESSSACELPDGSILCPDAGWVLFSRWNPPAADEEDRELPCPEFVIELRSKSDRLPGLRKKMEQWIANGCELAWLVDPSRKTVEIYRPGQSPEIQEGHSAVYGDGPVGGFVLELARIWS